MRSLRRNQVMTIYISDIVSMDGVDEYGNTGRPVYDDPVAMTVMLAPNDGTSSVHGFGKDFDYQLQVNFFGGFVPSENARIWIEADPNTDRNDYEIRAIRKYINHTGVWLRRCNGNE